MRQRVQMLVHGGLVALAMLVGACSSDSGPLDFTITYKDANGLRAGQSVIHKGLKIGEVQSMELDPGGVVKVGVRIAPEFRTKIFREYEFIIEKPNGMFDISGERQVTVNERGGQHTALAQGDIVEGTNGLIDQWLGRAKEYAQGALDVASALKDRTEQYVEEFRKSPEAAELKESLQRFAEKGSQLAEEQYKRFREDQLPHLRKQAEDLKKELEQSGKADEARRLWERYSAWESEVRR